MWRFAPRATVVFLVLYAAGRLSAAAEWVRIQDSRIEILTDAGEKTGRATLDRFEQLRRVFALPTGGPPVRVFLFDSEKEFRSFTNKSWVGSFDQRGLNPEFLVLHTTAGLTRVATHEYVHVVLGRGPPLPRWFEEGMAEMYSTLEFQGSRVLVGSPMPQHVKLLSAREWLSANQLTGGLVERASLDSGEVGMFYAESWALVHMLNFGPGWRERMPRFVEMLASDDRHAFQEAFGKTMDQAIAELHGYLMHLQGTLIEAPPPAERDPIQVSSLTPVQSILERAELALNVDHRPQAHKLFEDAARVNPQSPAAEAGLGLLAVAEDRRDQARTYFERAIEMGDGQPQTYFQLAMIEREAGNLTRRDELLQRVLTLNPKSGREFGEAHFLLGSEAADDSDWTAAIDHLRAAANALPRKSYVWHALGYAQSQLGLTGEARMSAARAIRTADTEQEQHMAEALMESLREPIR